MANTEYRIIFEDGAKSKIEKPTASNKSDASPSVDTSDSDALRKGIAGYASINYAMSVVDKLATSEINTVELRTGHQELQQRMQFAYGIAKQGVGIVSGAIAGAGVGGAVGALVGAVVGVADTLIGVGIKQNQLNVQRSVENQELYFNRIRAGAGQDRTGKAR